MKKRGAATKVEWQNMARRLENAVDRGTQEMKLDAVCDTLRLVCNEFTLDAPDWTGEDDL